MIEKKYIRDGRAPIPEKAITSKIMSAIKAKNTKPELALRNALWHNGLRGYRKHWKIVPGKPDIAFPGKKVAIFVNGCFWHRCPYCNPSTPKSNLEFWNTKFEKNTQRDINKISQLNQLGWETVTIWECELKKDITQSIEKIKATVEKK